MQITKQELDEYCKIVQNQILKNCPEVPTRIKQNYLEAIRVVTEAQWTDGGTIFATCNKFYLEFDFNQEIIDTIKCCKAITGYGATFHNKKWKLPLNEKTFEFLLYLQAQHGFIWYNEAVQICKQKFGDDCFNISQLPSTETL